MLVDSVYRGLFTKQVILAIPTDAAVFSMLITAFIVNINSDLRYAIIFVFLWAFFFYVDSKDRHIINIYAAKVRLLGFLWNDKKIRAVIHD